MVRALSNAPTRKQLTYIYNCFASLNARSVIILAVKWIKSVLMKKSWIKVIVPFAVLALGLGGMAVIKASADEDTEKEAVDTRPTVRIESLQAQDYQVVINSFGEVQPVESTTLAAQVSGEVVSWHPDFVPGGLIKRGDVLFSIEKDSYEAALLQAEADVSQAKAQLIEEQARANVARQEAQKLPANKVTDLYLRKPQVISAQAALKSAEARLKIAIRDLDNCDVTAPYDALVISRELGVGQYVNQGARVGEINNIESAEVIFPIAGFDSAFLPRSLNNVAAQVISKGIKNITRDGIIARDLGVVDQKTRMSQLVVRVNDPYSLNTDAAPLKFGSYVEVTFNGQTLEGIYRLPQELVNNRVVWVVKDQKLASRQVQILREEGEHFLIGGGLTNEDSVVLTLPEYPQNGMEVKIAAEEAGLVAQQAN